MGTDIDKTQLFYKMHIPADWGIKRFEEVCDIDKHSLKGNTPENYHFEYISLSDVDSDDFKIDTTKQIFKTAPSRARRIVRFRDILMSTVRPNLRGFVHIKNKTENLIASTGFAVISCKKINDEYLFHYLFSSLMDRQFYQLLVGSNYPAINSSDVKGLKIPYPLLDEQQKIAKVLGSIDDTINITTRLISKKEKKKKWLMQQLLTGKKRLNGFEEEWKEIHIKDVTKEVSIRNRVNNAFTVFSCTKYDGLVPSLEYFGRKIFSDDLSTYKVVPKGHFAYATNHIEEGSIGYQNSVDNGLISPMYTVFKSDESFVHDEFFYKLLKSHQMIYQYQNRMEGSIDRRGGLRWNAFSIIRIKLPVIEEQVAINRIIETANKEIKLLKEKVEKLKEQKKGLMQVLLTGKKRLK